MLDVDGGVVEIAAGFGSGELLFGLYSLIYGFSQVTAGVQMRQLGKSFRPLSEPNSAA